MNLKISLITLNPKSKPVDLRAYWKESSSLVKTSNKLPSEHEIPDKISFKSEILRSEISESTNGD